LKDNYEVVEAVDGREALKILNRQCFDLIIIDIKMPHIHGLEVIERVREKNKTVPIIICTAYSFFKDDIVIKTSDIAGFFTKPIDLQVLKIKVVELIGE